ncbi:carbohydrate porin [Massilia sp. BJB1822]|uniref:maltoporin n=1 Tax=Massilia sp. BJB1822 TaxID=2744470 RepID=UPI001593478E|nr:carbohydrate porin [Massilia sp. BJB1822]NVE00150.1 carbohydrate porin [Massilia sp. BJB1822]
MNRTIRQALSSACLLLGATASPLVFADDPGDDQPGFHGYLRAGAGTSSGATGGRQACFGLGGNTMRYRLGNECDAYGYFYYNREMMKSEDGVSFVATVGVRQYSPNSDFENKAVIPLGVHRAYVEAKGLDFLNGGVAWVGRREYVRPDIHMLDLFYTNLSGVGGGIDKVKAGPGKFSYAVFKDNDDVVTDTGSGRIVNSTAAVRQNLIYQDLPVNPGGTLDIVAAAILAKGEGKHNGYSLSLIHRQSKVFGGVNTIGVQYGVGPGVGPGLGRFGSSGSTVLNSEATRARLFDSLWIQPTREFSMELVALVQRDKAPAGNSTWLSFGVRPVYAFTRHFKLQAELGTDKVSPAGGGRDLRLTKLTVAPTISAGSDYWARPELRAFVTYGKWNEAATAAVNGANEAGPVFGRRTNAVSMGLQLEAWF